MFTVRSRSLMKTFSQILRLCHNSQDPFNLQNMQIIKTFDKTVDPYSKIYLETPMNVKITPVDLLDHPDGNKLLVSLYSRAAESSTDFTIKQTAKRVDVIGKKILPDADAVCVIQAPIRASFDIEAKGKSCISVSNMHSDDCILKSDSGMVLVKNIRGKNVKIRSKEGLVFCNGTVLAEKIDIRTDANVTCSHLRSNDLKIVTNVGDISTDSCYSDESHFMTMIGSLRLGSVHRNCSVEVLERGDLTLTGFDGTIKAILKRGNVHLQASRLHDKNSIFIHEAGTVDVYISDIIKDMHLIELIARKLNIEEEILKKGKILDDPQHQKFRYEDDQSELNDLYVECRNGTIEIKLSSWKKLIEEGKTKNYFT
ncbi:protein FAM185A [Arctopsyche grandis]|uniref:protein FAM185A n=1 Tax=Arctopsyche grandis TaxID=121162 RepID=UPI00406D86AD